MKANNAGKRLYRCDECKAEQFMFLHEFHRAARPRCTHCGSARLEPSSPAAKGEQIVGNRNVVEYEEGRGSVAPARRTGRSARRKIT